MRKKKRRRKPKASTTKHSKRLGKHSPASHMISLTRIPSMTPPKNGRNSTTKYWLNKEVSDTGSTHTKTCFLIKKPTTRHIIFGEKQSSNVFQIPRSKNSSLLKFLLTRGELNARLWSRTSTRSSARRT